MLKKPAKPNFVVVVIKLLIFVRTTLYSSIQKHIRLIKFYKTMKKNHKLSHSLLLLFVMSFLIVACQNTAETETPATTTSDTESTPTASANLPKYEFDADGALKKLDTDNYRRWIYVGTPLTPNDMNEPEAAFPEFHNVYIHPDDYDYWAANGAWQDGTILVKELVLVGKKQHVSGNGYFMGDFTGLEVTIKDKKRFPDEPGNWAYFSFGHEYPLAETATAFPTAACNACHKRFCSR